ncbi:MAG: multiple antibiotic resistance protein [Gammaproteobacteria bacterium]|jgi:multiple antibiotic resistance protein
MVETAIVALTTFFATIAPLEVAVMFAALTPTASLHFKRTMAIRSILISGTILILFALFGEFVLNALGISLAALKVAGGILLLLISIDMVFARPSGGTSTTKEEVEEAITSHDISVFPLATPLIAGPGAIGASILLMANSKDDLINEIIVIISLLTVLAFTFVLLILATRIQQVIKVTGMNVISRVFGVLLTALAVQFIIDGIGQSGLLKN